MSILDQTKYVNIELGKECEVGFDVYYEDDVPDNTRMVLDNFLNFFEEKYPLKTKFFIDFTNEDSVTGEDGSEQGYLFNWTNFSNYPKFEDDEEAPILTVPVKLGNWEITDILWSLVQGLVHYYAWICNRLDTDYSLTDKEIENIIVEFYGEE